MSKPKALFRKNTTLLHKEEGVGLKVDSKTYIQGKGWLYNLKVEGKDNEWKRYYENKIKKECKKTTKI